jgi:hypothetical protein
MKTILMVVVLGWLLPLVVAAKELEHRWEYLTFDNPPACGGIAPRFIVGYSDKSMGFRLEVSGLSPDVLKTNALSAKLHRANGQVVNADGKLLNSPIGLSSGGYVDWQSIAFFPWGTNTLEESWVEVRTGKEVYWLEIPYGFDRDPKQALPKPTTGGQPVWRPFRQITSDHEHIIGWKDVHYDLGEIQNKWRLSVVGSNPGEGSLDVVLYHDPPGVGHSIYQWELHTPRTSLRILEPGMDALEARCMGVRLHEDGMRRSDTFWVGDRRTLEKRRWAEVEVTVGDRSYRTVVPSSLYAFCHGQARGE